MKLSKLWTFLFISLFLVGCSDFHLEGAIGEPTFSSSSQIIIHYLDVGQGDSTVIELPNQEVMLIDAGESQYGMVVADYIEKLGYHKIDYLIGTHPHSDHIGGLKTIVNTFEIGKVYMPKAVSTSSTYLHLLEAIENKGLSILSAKAGMNILSTDDLQIDILAPNSSTYSNLNNYSIMLKIRYKSRSFLFTGDVEEQSEKEVLENHYDVRSDVVKVAHHGSDTSSSVHFVEQVHAQYAIVSVGKDNSYNLPVSSILTRWENSGASVLRTDLLKNIVLSSDGEKIQISDFDVSDSSVSEEEEEILESAITVLSLTNPIQKGSDATIQIQGKSNTRYTIQVFYKSGVSTASGLEAKESDENGKVTWTWKVSSNVAVGTYKIIVQDSEMQKIIEYEIVN